MGFNAQFDLFVIMFYIVFFLILGVFVAIVVSGLVGWNKNNNSPRIIVDALVVSKRTNVSHHHGSNHSMSHSHTTYYVTFQLESGDRMELMVNGSEYGMLAEGDEGKLTFQGTRYLDFKRRF